MTDPAVGLTWAGHATVRIDDRARILTDPVLTPSLLHLHRRAGQAPEPSLRRVDAVVISHLHADHLHLPSLALLEAGTPVLLPRGSARLLAGLPLDPVEVVAGDVVPVGNAEITVVPAAHADRRWPWSRMRGKAVGFVVRGHGATYFAGDTDAFPGMGDVADALDVALLPVGGWGPSLRGQHLDPVSAAACLPALDARVVVPIHYGTFWPRGFDSLRAHLFHEPGREFAAEARRRAPDVDVRLLAPGDSTDVRVSPR
jgi:L-ascorbate metabolism protein UlaG (beta-lactamase superfamily)